MLWKISLKVYEFLLRLAFRRVFSLSLTTDVALLMVNILLYADIWRETRIRVRFGKGLSNEMAWVAQRVKLPQQRPLPSQCWFKPFHYPSAKTSASGESAP